MNRSTARQILLGAPAALALGLLLGRPFASAEGAMPEPGARIGAANSPAAESAHVPLPRLRSWRTSALVFALRGAGVRPGRLGVRFDLKGDRRPVVTTDIARDCGALVFDADRDGTSGENGLELLGSDADFAGVGSSGGFENGFHALWGLARKAVADGVLPRGVLARQILDFDDLARLEAAYGLRMKVGSLTAKAVSLRDAGVAAIRLSKEFPSEVSQLDAVGDGIQRQPGAAFVRADGTEGAYEDVWFRAR